MLAIFHYIKLYLLHYKEKERKVHKDNSKYCYIIRFNKKEGLLSMFFKAAALVEYAEKKGYRAYIDMKNFSTQYTDSEMVNAWEYFFTQPWGMTEETAYAKNYILYGWQWGGYKQFQQANLFGPYFAGNYKRNQEKKKFIFSHFDFSPQIHLMIKEESEKLPDLKNMLGVYIRGTDYIATKPSGHPIQPSIDKIIEKCDDFLSRYTNIKGIYLVTEDQKYYETMKVKYKQCLYISYQDNFIKGYNYEKKKYLYETFHNENIVRRGQEYLCKIILLSKCGYLVSSLTNGSVTALAFNGDEYKDRYIFDLGLYK